MFVFLLLISVEGCFNQSPWMRPEEQWLPDTPLVPCMFYRECPVTTSSESLKRYFADNHHRGDEFSNANYPALFFADSGSAAELSTLPMALQD